MGRNEHAQRVSVIGTGYLGLTHAVCMADLGHQVLAIDVDTDKLAKAARGEAPFFEPGLEPLLRKNLDSGRLRFTPSFADVGEFADVHFLCVGTPQAAGGHADLSYLYAAVDALAPHLAGESLLVGKSTVPVGTARLLLAEAIGLDERIGRRFLSPGLGFGGGCLPKDIRAFRAAAAEKGIGSLVDLLTTVDTINLDRRERVTAMAREAVGGDLTGKRIAVLGVAFKPNSDDIRDSPSLDICVRLTAEGARVSVHDPVAMSNAARIRPELRYADSVHEAAEDAEIVLHLTEWSDYRAIDPATLAKLVAQPVLIDARCTLDADLWRTAGWSVYVPGRP
jgi:UDPglucose 6-dehydrogenase